MISLLFEVCLVNVLVPVCVEWDQVNPPSYTLK
uniref:Uncharacterized protein n=1 Tax=Rhizophora mucronata TaxID=61149 RepID=A0A2P2NEF1_RHIMU